MQLGTGSRAEAETEKEPQKPLTIQHKASNSCVLLRIDLIDTEIRTRRKSVNGPF